MYQDEIQVQNRIDKSLEKFKEENLFKEIRLDKTQIMSLQPDDVVVLSLVGKCNDSTFERLKCSFSKILPKQTVIILEDGCDLFLLRKEI